MEENKLEVKKYKDKLAKWSKKVFAFMTRWFFMISLLAAAIFCVFVWYNFVWKANWDDAKKQSYISEQAKFSFDKAGYLKMIEYLKNRKEKLDHYPKFSGRDIFFPDGF